MEYSGDSGDEDSHAVDTAEIELRDLAELGVSKKEELRITQRLGIQLDGELLKGKDCH